MAELKYVEIQVETHFDGSNDRMEIYTGLADAQAAEVRFEKNMGTGIDASKNNKTILNIALASNGSEVPGCNEFYSRVPLGGPDDIIKYYHLMYTTKKDGTADSVDLKSYTDYETAKDNHHTKLGSALDKENTKTVLSKVYNSHGGTVMMKYRDLDPEPEPEPPIPPEPEDE